MTDPNLDEVSRQIAKELARDLGPSLSENVPPPALSAEALRAQRARNIAIALGLAVFVVLVFVVTLVRLRGNVAQDVF